MRAGPELDALIAEKVMGFTIKNNSTGTYYQAPGSSLWPVLLPYSTDIASAWLVWMHMQKREDAWDSFVTLFTLLCKPGFTKQSSDDELAWVFRGITPERICLAALACLSAHVPNQEV